MKTHKPRTAPPAPAIDEEALLSQLSSVNVYDCFGFLPGRAPLYQGPSARLFTNQNVGNLNLTNLQIPGEMRVNGGRGTFIVTNWYARTNIPKNPELDAIVLGLSHHTYCSLQIGDKVPVWRMSLYDLFRSWRDGDDKTQHRQAHPLWPQLIGDRQTAHVHVDMFSSGSQFFHEQIMSRFEGDYEPWSGMTPIVWIHIEGLFLRRELYFTPEDREHEDLYDEQIKAWYQVTGRVIRHLTRGEKERRLVCEHVAEWVDGFVEDARDPDSASQIAAIADGIREGRHESGRHR